METKRTNRMLTHPLTVRLSDKDWTRIVDTAWRQRIAAAELVRRLVIRSLESEEQGAAQ